VFNGIDVELHWPAHDPTPIAAGLGAIALRWGVVELLGAQFLTARARSDLLDQIEVAILVADAQGRILEANRMARQLFDGRTPVGVDLREALVRFGGDPGFSVREFPLPRRGARVGLGAVITDRREERAAERRIDVENRLEALGILAGGLAHEINNPLAVVSGNAELLAMRLRNRLPDALGVEIARLLGDIDAGAARIAEIVRRMLRLSAPADDAPGAEAVDVALVAERAAALARIGKGAASVEVRGGSAHARASVRTGELLELLFHLIQNAVQASGGGTPVEVQIDSAEASVQIRVLDRGPGLPNGDATRVFEPFFTTDQPRRTGLGLSLCWELARQNGGTLEAFARDGGGTEFRLVLPRA
jgi:signal transduction histidine kinase